MRNFWNLFKRSTLLAFFLAFFSIGIGSASKVDDLFPSSISLFFRSMMTYMGRNTMIDRFHGRTTSMPSTSTLNKTDHRQHGHGTFMKEDDLFMEK